MASFASKKFGPEGSLSSSPPQKKISHQVYAPALKLSCLVQTCCNHAFTEQNVVVSEALLVVSATVVANNPGIPSGSTF